MTAKSVPSGVRWGLNNIVYRKMGGNVKGRGESSPLSFFHSSSFMRRLQHHPSGASSFFLRQCGTLILSLKGSSITCELMEHFGCTKTLVSEPAFVKRRGRLLPEALETIFRLFVENTRPSNRYKGFRLLAVDGSDLHTPTNPDDTASFIPGSGGQKPYNLKHLNALYDLCSHIYTDAIVQGRHQYDERRALCDMVDRANATSLLSSSLTEVMSPITSLPIFRKKVGNS